MSINRINFFYFLLLSFAFICLIFYGHTVSAATTTIRLYPQEGTGYLSVWAGAAGTWDDVHDASYGNQGVRTELLKVYTGKTGTPANYLIIRSFLVFNTSVLPEDVEITDAELNLIVQSHKQSYANDGYDYIGLVKTSQEDLSSLTENDYDQCGAVDNPILGNENKPDYTDINIGDTVSISFNKTGLSWINKDGITAIGLREGHDIEDYDPGYPAYKKNSVFFYSHEAEDLNFRPYLEITYTLPNEPQINPVIVIPGIMGSWEKKGEWVMDPILHTYDNLWEALKLAGYKEGKSLFSAPYEWRYSNTISVIALENKIQQAKNACQCDKVDLVAHSMGGLVAREYIESASYGSSSVDKLIFLATPHQGAPSAYLTWEGGEMGIGLKNKLVKKLFEQEAYFYGYKNLFSYVREFPVASVEELLPVYDYLKDAATGELKIYSNGYPVNNFLDLLNNSARMDKLNAVNITNIIADNENSSTINAIRVVDKNFSDGRWEHGYPEHYSLPFTDHGLEMGAGDGTVPFASNGNFFSSGNVEIISTHSGIVTDAQKQVIKKLTGIEPAEKATSTLIQRILLVRVFSPVDLLIISPSGKKLGKDFFTDSEINKEINDIAGAFYSGFDSDIEFATIPNPEDGAYTVSLQGVEDGLYEIRVDLLLDNGLLDAAGHIIPGVSSENEIENFNFSITPESEEQPELIKEISFSSTILDLKELNSVGEILKIQAYSSLSARLSSLEKTYEKMNEKKYSWLREIHKKRIVFSLNLIKVRLNFYKLKNWITEDAFNILIYDIDSLVGQL